MDRKTAYDTAKQLADVQAPGDGSMTRTQAQREALMARTDLTAGQKAWLDLKLIGKEDSDHDIDYRTREGFEITSYVADGSRRSTLLMPDGCAT